MSNILYVDRIEGERAVCETPARERVELPRADLPPGLREGDCLRRTAAGWAVDEAETDRRRAHNKALFDKLLGRSPPD